jgi:hypothetical protein
MEDYTPLLEISSMLAAPSNYERRFFKELTRHGHLNYFGGLLFLALIDSFYSFRESFSMPRVSLDFVVEELRSRAPNGKTVLYGLAFLEAILIRA